MFIVVGKLVSFKLKSYPNENNSLQKKKGVNTKNLLLKKKKTWFKILNLKGT